MNIEYVNIIAMPDEIEQCNFSMLGIKFYQWYGKANIIDATVCIWRIKYKK